MCTDFTTKYTTANRALMGGILKILNLSEILPVHLADRLYLSVEVTGDIWSRPDGRRKLIAICRKFVAVSSRIWQTGPQNLEKFAAENCVP